MAMKALRQRIKTWLRRSGFELVEFIPEQSGTAQLLQTLTALNVDAVMDVGANVGQFALDLRAGGYAGRIISIEPQPEAHRGLCTAAAKDPLWEVAPPMVLSNRVGEETLHVAQNSESSSVLAMNELHVEAAPASRLVDQITVPANTLDAVGAELAGSATRLCLKLDVQGFEWQVLEGAGAFLPRCAVIASELSLQPLYEGQHDWRAMIERFEALGYTLWGLDRGFTDPRNGRGLQLDGLFVRSELL